MKKRLWTSRHELDEAAKATLPGPIHSEPECKEILWPEDPTECYEIVKNLTNTYDVVAGVFPAQALEAIMLFHYSGFDGCYYPQTTRFYSAVSRPIREPDTGKVRGFEFIRWALII